MIEMIVLLPPEPGLTTAPGVRAEPGTASCPANHHVDGQLRQLGDGLGRVAAGQPFIELVDRQPAVAGRLAQLVGRALAFQVGGAQRRQGSVTIRGCRWLRALIGHRPDGLGTASSKRGRPSSGISSQAGW